MDRDNRLRRARDPRSREFWAQIERRRINIDEHRHRTQTPNGARRGEESKARQDHFVTRPDAQRHQRQEHRVAPRCAADRVLCAGVIGDARLQLLHVRPKDKLARVTNTVDCRAYLFTQRRVLPADVQ